MPSLREARVPYISESGGSSLRLKNIRGVSDIEDLLRGTPNARELHSMWECGRPAGYHRQKRADAASGASTPIPWINDASLACGFTAHAIEQQEFLLVLDCAREALRGWDRAPEEQRTALIRVRLDYAAALARLGFTREARLELEPLIQTGFHPHLGRKLKIDVLMQLGHILREEWHFAPSRAAQIQSAQDALAFYDEVLKLDPDQRDALVLTASTAFILGDVGATLRAQAEETAREIQRVAGDLIDSEGPRRRTTGALATAQAILGKVDEATRSFHELAEMHGVGTPELAEARFQAQFLAEALGKPRDFFKAAFPSLQLIVFAGHLPDRPGRRVRFTAEMIPGVREALHTTLAGMGARVGMASASAGADLLFSEALLELRGTLHLVLPWSQEEFRRTSVLPYEPVAGPSLWEPLYDAALAAAAT